MGTNILSRLETENECLQDVVQMQNNSIAHPPCSDLDSASPIRPHS